MASEENTRTQSVPTMGPDMDANSTDVFSNPPPSESVPQPVPRPTPRVDDTDGLRDSFKTRPKGSWHQNYTVDWKEKWTDDTWNNGRVLIIDYMRWNKTKGGKLKIHAQEIKSREGLVHFYSNTARCKQAAFRVIHVQNAPWAVRFLTHKYNAVPSDDLVGMDFGKWAKFDQPEWRAGKPLLKGRTWRTQRDPWRGVRRTAFGLDYLRGCDIREDTEGSHLANSDAGRRVGISEENKMMELNCYDNADAPCYGWDVFVQRLSVYVQFSDPGGPDPPHGVKNPYEQAEYESSLANKEDWKHAQAAHGHSHWPKLPAFDTLDNGNTIVVFENSQDKSVTTTLLGARQQIESRWRRLSFYLPAEHIIDDSRLALECMDLVLEDVFKALAINWESFLGVAETHIAILEDKIYESPADESRAPELWYNSSAWLKVERLCFIHEECVKELLVQLGDLIPRELEQVWLDGIAEQFNKITNLVQEDLVKPTSNLSDLMYKSVEIRDSRQSLGLSTSMWRLSWITFIFLPLTFIVGFFGMNVDTFQDNPSIKYYFAAAVPLMLLVLILWYILKHALASRRQTPYQRGVYEHLYHDLANQNSQLWSRAGPRRDVQPVGFYSRVRWWFLRRWFDPRRTISKPTADPDEDVGGSGLGAWARCKRMLARRWLGSITARRRVSLSESEQALNEETALNDLVAVGTTAGAAETVPTIASVTKQNLDRLSPPAPSNRTASPRPSSSGGSSGVMVEEQDPELIGVGAGNARGRGGVRRSIDGVMETLGVTAL